MSSNIPKAILYYYPQSIWSCLPLLTLTEKGYGDDELDLKIVDLSKGENYSPTFLRLNPKATVPTLVVPLEKTLSDEVESRYKALTDSKAIVEFLDKSRSPLSRTHTTSDAPAPSLAPATIAFSATSNTIIDDIIRSEQADAITLFYMNARDDSSLKTISTEILPLLKGKQQALTRHLSDAESGKTSISEKVKSFWRTRKGFFEGLLAVFEHSQKTTEELDEESKAKRAEYFNASKLAWEVGLPKVLSKLNDEVIGPFALGEQLSIADLHITAWLASVAKSAGATPTDDGNTAIEKIEKYIGSGFSLPRGVLAIDLMKVEGERPPTRSKLASFWDAMKERPSWKKVYANGLI